MAMATSSHGENNTCAVTLRTVSATMAAARAYLRAAKKRM
jgi:hypothetical protein